ncbi:MAG: aliphatic sulfonate ABC transporter substrate-binding protein [Candidatus Velthaea sp.]
MRTMPATSMMRRCLSLAALATLMVTLVIPAAQTEARAKPSKNLTLSMGVFPALRPLELVRAMGWLEQDGYTVKWTDFLSGMPQEGAAMVSGAIDFAEGDTTGATAVFEKAPGVGWYIASVTGNYVQLVVRKDSGIKTLADLKGKKIATSGNNTAPQVILNTAMKKAGLNPEDVQFFQASGEAQVPLMQKGAVDGAISYVPFSSEMIVNGTGTLLLTADQMYGKSWTGGAEIVRVAFAKEHPEAVLDVLRAMQRAQDMLQKDPAAARKALAKVTNIPLEVIEHSYKQKFVTLLPLTPNIPDITEQLELLHKFGVLKSEPKALISDFIHPEFAERAFKK